MLKVVVYDALGAQVITPVNETLAPGTYEIQFDGTNYPSGVYFYELEAGDYVEVKKMILVR